MRSHHLLIPFVATMIACSAPVQDFEVQVEVNEQISTVLDISWTTSEPGISWVEFGRDGAYDLSTPVSTVAGTEHRFQLIGVGAGSEISFRAITEIGEGQSQLVTEGSASNGELPEDMPRFRVETYEEELVSSDRWMLTGYESEEGSWIVAVDRRGGVVWYERVPDDGMPFSVEVKQDEPGVIYNARQRDGLRDKSWLVETTLLEDLDSQLTLQYGHHAMTQLPSGAVAWIGAELREWTHPISGETMVVQGDTININTEDGQIRELFNMWDFSEPEPSPWFDSEYFEGAKDWTHANALSYNDKAGTILFSIRNLAMLLEIDAGTGVVKRALGGSSTLAFSEGSRRFSYQHDPNWTPDGTILMVSTSPKENGRQETVAVEYQVDAETDVLTEVWSYGADLDLHASYHGGARALSNGNRLVNFGSAGVVHEATPEGETAWAVTTNPAVAYGSTLMVDDLYGLVR